MDVSISIPDTDGIALNGVVPVTVEAHPPANLRYVRLTIDGTVVMEDMASPYVYQWDTTLVTDGTHILVAVAQYKTRKSQAQIAVTVNNTAVPPPPPPPPAGILPARPPGWDGSGPPNARSSYPASWTERTLTVVNNKPVNLSLSLDEDCFLNFGKVEWSSGPFPTGSDMRTVLGIAGGRKVVAVGGEMAFNSTNTTDDCAGILREGGGPDSELYLEGILGRSVNCITLRRVAGRLVLQNMHLEARTFEDRHDPPAGDGNHPDIVQAWDGTENLEVFMHRVTGYTWFTGLVSLLSQPKRWTRQKVDLHFGTRLGATQQMGNYMLYLTPGNQQPVTLFDGTDDNWMDLGYWGGIREQLQMAIDSPGWSWHLGYEIWRPSTGQRWTSSDPNAFRGSLVSVGATQGDQWRCTSHPVISEKWNWGVPPGGEYVPASSVGVGYVSPGYV